MHSRFAWAFSLLVLSLPTVSMASDSFTQLPRIFGGDPALDQLRSAYLTVHADPLIQKFLSDGNTNALSIAQRVKGKDVATTKFQHFYKGVEVMGSMSFYHAGRRGSRLRHWLRRFDLDTRPGITAEMAVAIAKSVAGDHPLAHAPELKVMPGKNSDSAHLIYWVDLKNEGINNPGADVLVDAQNGALIANLSKLETIAPIQVVSAQKQGVSIRPVIEQDPLTQKFALKGCELKQLETDATQMLTVTQCKGILRGTEDVDAKCQIVMFEDEVSGGPLGMDPGTCKKVVTDSVARPEADESAVAALNNSKKVLAYYHDVHGRDGFDDAGSEVVNVVHAGVKYANAAWVQGADFMMYGDGDGETMGDMTRGLDVAGHELTHGITSKTAKLTMMDEAGALNEAYSDFFGKMIAKDGSWIVGAELSLDLKKFPGIRNLADPKSFEHLIKDASGAKVKKGYPAKSSEAEKKRPGTTCDESNDRCWVHHNSTVASHAAYLIYNAIGAEKAQNLYYLTLTQYLSSEADFAKSAEATLAACQAEYDSATCDQVRKIFVETEMLKN